jgi:hypothetical protein
MLDLQGISDFDAAEFRHHEEARPYAIEITVANGDNLRELLLVQWKKKRERFLCTGVILEPIDSFFGSARPRPRSIHVRGRSLIGQAARLLDRDLLCLAVCNPLVA